MAPLLAGACRRWLPLLPLLAVAAVLLPAVARADWSAFVAPLPATDGLPQGAIGSPERGCLVGAAMLPTDGDGYQLMRLSRGRNYGDPRLTGFVVELSRRMLEHGYAGLLIGDLAQARGGPMASGHRSHQTGLDVDIWFTPAPARTLTIAERETIAAPSMVAADGLTVSEAWSPQQETALRLAAAFAEVDRIFVNPVLKQALCLSEAGDRQWLHKLRPWWGHDAHFHVRLACPDDAPLCRPQPPVPAGDGCGADLAWWFSAEAAERARAQTPPRPLTLDDLPPACRAVFDAG
jgi:penicillin-insensitive murein endopeptidase